MAHKGIEGTACTGSLAAKRASPYLATPYSGRAWEIAETDATSAAMAIIVLIISDLLKSQTRFDLTKRNRLSKKSPSEGLTVVVIVMVTARIH